MYTTTNTNKTSSKLQRVTNTRTN